LVWNKFHWRSHSDTKTAATSGKPLVPDIADFTIFPINLRTSTTGSIITSLPSNTCTFINVISITWCIIIRFSTFSGTQRTHITRRQFPPPHTHTHTCPS
jgi:hypothetical protein